MAQSSLPMLRTLWSRPTDGRSGAQPASEALLVEQSSDSGGRLLEIQECELRKYEDERTGTELVLAAEKAARTPGPSRSTYSSGNSSGVHKIGGSNPAARQSASMRLRIRAFAICVQFQVSGLRRGHELRNLP